MEKRAGECLRTGEVQACAHQVGHHGANVEFLDVGDGPVVLDQRLKAL